MTYLKNDTIKPTLQPPEKIKDKEENINIIEDIIENDDWYTMPLDIKKIIESYIVDITIFEIDKKLDRNNAFILMKISGEKIAVVNDSKMTIYNHPFLIYNEIDVNLFKNKKEIIKSIYETKDRNLICSYKEEDIFKLKIEIK